MEYVVDVDDELRMFFMDWKFFLLIIVKVFILFCLFVWLVSIDKEFLI